MRLFTYYFCCCIAFILVVAQLKPVEENEEKNQFILKTVAYFDKYVHVTNFITFSDNVQLEKSALISTPLQKRLTESFTYPVIVAGSDMGQLLCQISYRSITIIPIGNFTDPILNVVSNTLRGEKLIFFIYELGDNTTIPTTLMENFFIRCWRMSFIFTFLIVKQNNQYELWTYKMKPKFIMYNFWNWLSVPNQCYNFYRFGNMDGYRVSVVLFESLPDAFLFNSLEQHDITGTNVSLGGQSGFLIAEFIRYANGSLNTVLTSSKEYSIKTDQMSGGNQSIDMGANLVSNASLTLYSPVVRTIRVCMVLPYSSHVKQDFDFQFHNWSVMVFMAFCFVVYTVIRRLNNQRMPMIEILFASFRLCMGYPMEGRIFRRLRLATQLIEISTQMYCMLMLSIYGGVITMSLTLGLPKSNIVDVESFMASGLRIMVNERQLHSFFEDNRLPMALTDRFLVVNESTRNEHLHALNDSYAYMIKDNKWVHMQFLQNRLKTPKLRLSPQKLCGVQAYQRLPVREDLPFLYGLQQFISYAHEGGLTEKWMMLGLRQAQLSGLFAQASYEYSTMKPLNFQYFQRGFTVFIGGLVLSLVCFVMEHVYERWIRKYRRTGI